MGKYLEIVKENSRHNIWIHTGISILLLCLSPLILGIENLPPSDTAKVLEMYAALLGILLLIPIFLPEQNKELRDLIRSKYTSITAIYVIRALESVIILSLLLGSYMAVLAFNGCAMEFPQYFAGTLAEMLFMGGLGLFGYAVFDNLIVGYMIPVIYYITAIGNGNKILGVFYPFSMYMGSYTEKYWLLAAGLLLGILGIYIRGKK